MSVKTTRIVKDFLADRRGAVVVAFAISLIPIMGMVGASVDYSRASNVRGQLQSALDASVLAVAHNQGMSDVQVERELRAQVDAMMGGAYGSTGLTLNIARNQNDNLLEVAATLNLDTTIFGVMGINYIRVGANSAVSAEYRALEVALVLDNTGSMSRHMRDLRTAAQDFVDVVTEEGSNANTSVALVPYVAAVNIGNTAATRQMLDTQGLSSHHASIMEWRWLGKYNHCSWPGGGGGGPVDHGPGGNEGASLTQPTTEPRTQPVLQVPGFELASFDDVYIEAFHALFGINTAQANAPYTYDVYQGCFPRNPGQISHWQLFTQLGIQWKGCVEARPQPHNVLDTPPNPNDPNTLWVPYFWIDDSDRFQSWVPRGNNDWIRDTPFLNNTDMATNFWGRTHSVLKYTTANARSIDESPPSTRGPNMSCGDPIVPLTNNYATISDAIARMSHWNNGGTQTAPGVAWGWRTLSPTAPFTEGLPYGEVTKVMVVMTDGENMLVRSDNDSVLSDYSAYGHLRWGRYPAENTNSARQYIDSRTLAACTNAKAAGVLVYTVTFGLSNRATRRFWDSCATEHSMSYHVDTARELQGAFNSIATAVGELRLTR